jgi:hypothetical protein
VEGRSGRQNFKLSGPGISLLSMGATMIKKKNKFSSYHIFGEIFAHFPIYEEAVPHI